MSEQKHEVEGFRALLEIIKKAHTENFEYIKGIRVPDNIKGYTLPDTGMFFEGEIPKIVNESILSEFITEEIKLDLMGHDGNSEVVTLAEYPNIKGRFHNHFELDDIKCRLSRILGRVLISYDESIDYNDSKELESLIVLNLGFHLGMGKFCIRVLDDNFVCKDCGHTLSMELNLETMTIEPSKEYTHESNSWEDAERCVMENDTDFECSVEFDVPSGKLMLCNDIRRILPDGDSVKSYKYSDSKKGSHEYMKAWAEKGVLWLQTSNTCVEIHQLDDGTINGEQSYEIGYDPTPEGENKGCISCGLWAVTAVDYDVFLKLKENVSKDTFDEWSNYQYPTVVDIPSKRCKGKSYLLDDSSNGDDKWLKIIPI